MSSFKSTIQKKETRDNQMLLQIQLIFFNVQNKLGPFSKP